MFAVDASESMDPARFQNEMLNYVQSLYCAFNPADVNRAGLITFASEIAIRIPLDRYTPDAWFAKVEDVRSQNLCCSCCTPTATAFLTARQAFEAVPIGDAFRIVFVITDGAPWQNLEGPFNWPSVSSAEYTWGVVAEQARLLKEMSSRRVRIMMVGVPNKDMVPPREEYFRGKPDPNKTPAGKNQNWQCNTRDGKKTCFLMSKPPFPIVTEPIDKNIFTSDNWDVQNLLDLTVNSTCEVEPTPSPTRPPTTLTPTRPPTDGPTPRPTNIPTKLPTKQPTFAPSRLPTASPLKPELDGLDMYFLLDRSRSMRWVPDLCRSAPGGNPTDNDSIACWRLFLKFVGQIVDKTAAIKYRQTTLGWKADNAANLKRGIRVWIYAFACSGHQSTPITITVGEKLGSKAEFNAALASASAMIPDGGTCPGAAIEKAAATIQGTDLLTRIYKTAILFTDGVFYDMPRPKKAAAGLFHFGVLTYSMGVSIPLDGNNHGLTKAEIKTQRTQLLSFVENEENRFFNFGLEGLNLLDSIAQELADQLPYDAIDKFPDVEKQPYWCGWTSISRCTETDDADTNTGKYCFWHAEKNVCLAKTWCKYTNRATCEKDAYCQWKFPGCVAKVELN
jgi:hypothetical protein